MSVIHKISEFPEHSDINLALLWYNGGAKEIRRPVNIYPLTEIHDRVLVFLQSSSKVHFCDMSTLLSGPMYFHNHFITNT